MRKEPDSGSPTPQAGLDVSVVIPVYNEVDNLLPLHGALSHVLGGMARTSEILFVDDGSDDGTHGRLLEIRSRDPRVRVIRFRRNFGQTSAMAAGFDHARGAIVVTMDGDLQNDPSDIPSLVEALEGGGNRRGFDIVCGWRRDRRDAFLTRLLPSVAANRLVGWVTGVRIHDTGCTLKAYRRWVVRNLMLYSDMHRFIPALAAGAGARVGEVPVRHHSRRYGTSKYGIARVTRVLFDLLAVKMLVQFSAHPIRWFGLCSVPLFVASAVFFIAGLTQFGAAPGVTMVERWSVPSMTLSLVTGIVAVNFFLMGLLCELAVKASGVFVRRSTHSFAEGAVR